MKEWLKYLIILTSLVQSTEFLIINSRILVPITLWSKTAGNRSYITEISWNVRQRQKWRLRSRSSSILTIRCYWVRLVKSDKIKNSNRAAERLPYFSTLPTKAQKSLISKEKIHCLEVYLWVDGFLIVSPYTLRH